MKNIFCGKDRNNIVKEKWKSQWHSVRLQWETLVWLSRIKTDFSCKILVCIFNACLCFEVYYTILCASLSLTDNSMQIQSCGSTKCSATARMDYAVRSPPCPRKHCRLRPLNFSRWPPRLIHYHHLVQPCFHSVTALLTKDSLDRRLTILPPVINELLPGLQRQVIMYYWRPCALSKWCSTIYGTYIFTPLSINGQTLTLTLTIT